MFIVVNLRDFELAVDAEGAKSAIIDPDCEARPFAIVPLALLRAGRAGRLVFARAVVP